MHYGQYYCVICNKNLSWHLPELYQHSVQQQYHSFWLQLYSYITIIIIIISITCSYYQTIKLNYTIYYQTIKNLIKKTMIFLVEKVVKLTNVYKYLVLLQGTVLQIKCVAVEQIQCILLISTQSVQRRKQIDIDIKWAIHYSYLVLCGCGCVCISPNGVHFAIQNMILSNLIKIVQ